MVDEQIIQALRGEQLEEEVLDRMRAALRAGLSVAMLARAAIGAAPTYENVVRTMRAIERIAQLDVDLGLKLMVGLYPAANEILAHDICDSIELWLEHEGTHELRDFVSSLLSADPPFEAREKLSTWIQLIDKA